MDISQAQIDSVQSQFTTVEQIAGWAGILLHKQNPTKKILEVENDAQLAAQASIFTDAYGTDRLVIRLSLPLAVDYAEGARKLWASVGELSEISIPAAYL